MHKKVKKRHRRFHAKIWTAIFGVSGLLLAVYVVTSILKGEHLENVSVGGFDAEENAFTDFSYKTQDNSGKSIVITSKKVKEQDKHTIVFDDVKSNFSISDKETGTISADEGRIVREKQKQRKKSKQNKQKEQEESDEVGMASSMKDGAICEFKGNVKMSTKSGINLRSNEAVFDSKKKIVSGNSPINITKSDVEVSADRYKFDTQKNILKLKKNAKVQSKGRDITSEKMTIFFGANQTEALKKIIADKNVQMKSQDYQISAEDKVTFDFSKSKTGQTQIQAITAKKNVVFKSQDYNLFARDSVDFKQELNQLTANGAINFTYTRNCNNFVLNSDKIQMIMADRDLDKSRRKLKSAAKKADIALDKRDISEVIATGNVRIKARDSVIRSERAVYKKNSGSIFVYGNVVISKSQGDIFGEQAELNLSTGKISVKKLSAVVSGQVVKEKVGEK